MITSIQTRDIHGECREYASVTEAFVAAEAITTIEKISFNDNRGGRIRLVRDSFDTWRYEPILPVENI